MGWYFRLQSDSVISAIRLNHTYLSGVHLLCSSSLHDIIYIIWLSYTLFTCYVLNFYLTGSSLTLSIFFTRYYLHCLAFVYLLYLLHYFYLTWSLLYFTYLTLNYLPNIVLTLLLSVYLLYLPGTFLPCIIIAHLYKL